jgi:predicted pyridoxine 5'-phosphate oxidase superfamily flavin-nucleotide-binding protein
MTYGFLDALTTPGVRAAREANGVGQMWDEMELDLPQNRLTDRELSFIAARDSFYIASISETGWPYIQHRGGPAGFLRPLSEQSLGFTDYAGNRQYLTLGNISSESRVALFLMDYPNRRRLKILAHMTTHDLAAEPNLASKLATSGHGGRPERGFTLQLHAFDWNCPQHITPRFTEMEFVAAMAERANRQRKECP